MPTLTGKTWTLPPRPDGKLYMSDGEWTSGAQIWLSTAEIASLPESGTYWADVYARATSTFANPTGGNNDIADTNTLATALVAATGDSAMLTKCQGLLQAAVTGALTLETSLSSCRNLGNYAIAADLIRYYDATFVNWIKTIVARNFEAWGGGQDGNAIGEGSIFWKIWKVNNHGSMALGCFAALSYYLHRLEPTNAQWRANLDHIYQCLRYYSGEDPSITPSSLGYSGKSAWNYGPDSANWQQLIDSNYYVIYPQGATYQTNSIDGLMPEEARRGSATYVYPAPDTTYYGESLQGLTVCYRIMSQAGYNVLPLGNYAHRRAVSYLYNVLGYPLTGDDLYLLPLLDYMYGINAIQAGGLWGGVTVDQGKNMGWTDWSHGERVNYTIPVPLAPTIDSSDATSITIRFPASAASGHASWQVLRATAAQLPFYNIVATGVTAATYASTGLTTGTTYYHVLRDVITSGRVSASGASVSRSI